MSGGRRPIWMGITKPASTNPPTQEEIEETKILHNILLELNDFPSQEENMKREQVLGKLDKIIQDFVVNTAKTQSFGALATDCRSQLVTSGSFRLGVHGPGADIDTICILPNFVKPRHFFEELPNVLNQCPEVRDLTCVSEATVPLIKLEFDGVELDLLYAPLRMDIIPKNLDVLDVSLLRGIDQRTVRALNGPRVAAETLDLVNRKDTYRLALRFIRQWAKRRGIYGNVHGYLGGVHCSLLVARICQLFPYTEASVIVRQFFTVYGCLWKWPQPVLLKKIEKRDDLNLDVWDPHNRRNRNHILPIITPAYPSQNTTHNVHPATKRVILEEFSRGERILPSEFKGVYTPEIFKEILEETDFFIRYKTFLRVDVMARTQRALGIWKGFVESKFRFFASNLQRLIGECMLVHVYPQAIKKPRGIKKEEKEEKNKMVDEDDDGNKGMEKKDGIKEEEEEEEEGEGGKVVEEDEEPYCVSLFVGLQFQRERMNINIMSVIARFHSIVNTWESKTEEMLPCNIERVKRSEIPVWVLPPDKKKKMIRIRNKERKRKRIEMEKEEAEEAERLRKAQEELEGGSTENEGIGPDGGEEEGGEDQEEKQKESKDGENGENQEGNLEPAIKKRKLEKGDEKIEEIRKSVDEQGGGGEEKKNNDVDEKNNNEEMLPPHGRRNLGYKETILEDDEDEEDFLFPKISTNTPATPREEDSFNIIPQFNY